MHYDPASTIIEKLGGVRSVAQIAGVSVHTVTKWRLAREKSGTGGIIPHWHVRKLLDGAKDRGVVLSPSEFVQEHEVAA